MSIVTTFTAPGLEPLFDFSDGQDVRADLSGDCG